MKQQPPAQQQAQQYAPAPALTAVEEPEFLTLPLPPLYSRRRQRRRQIIAALKWSLFGLVSALLCLVALFSYVVGGLLWWIQARSFDRREFGRWLWTMAAGGTIIYVAWLYLSSPWPWFWQSLSSDLARHLYQAALSVLCDIWLFDLLLAPLFALVFPVLNPRKMPRPTVKDATENARLPELPVVGAHENFAQMLRGEQSAEERRTLAALAAAPAPAPLIVQSAPGQLEALGTYEGGELGEWTQGGQFCLNPAWLNVHGILIGEPNFGKTTTLMRLLIVARKYGRRVVYLDLKGSKQTAALFLATMRALGVRQIKMFPQAAYDGWRGDAQALFNRLMEQIDPRTHPFYRGGVGATVVSLALNAPGGLPTNSYQFLERLDTRWLKRAYATDAQALREIHDVGPHIGGLALLYAGFFRGIAGALDGSWAFEDAEACYVGLDGTAHKEEAAVMGRYLLEDAAHFAVARKAADDQVTFIIDEFGVLRSTNATDLFERVREAGMSVFAAAQSYQGLGIERDNVLAAAAVKILHRSGSPEPVVKYAGEREQPQFSRYVGGGNGQDELLPMTNNPHQAGQQPDTLMRQQKEYTVPVEDVQQLPLGKVVFITGGEAAYVQVYPLNLSLATVAAARNFLAAMPGFKPLPPPKATPAANQADQQKSPAAARPARKPAPGPGQPGPTTGQPARPVPTSPRKAAAGPRTGPGGQSGQNVDFFS